VTKPQPVAIRRCATIPPPWGLLTLGLLTLIPGDAFCRLFFASPRASVKHLALTFGEGLFLRLFSGILLVGWWAVTLAEAGYFGRGGVLLGIGALSILGYALAWRRKALNFAAPRFLPTIAGSAVALILLLSGLLTFGRPFETVVGGEDAGVYFNSGALIAQTGSIRFHDPGLDEFGPDAADNAWFGGAARHILTPPPANPPRGNDSPKRYLFLDWQRLSGFNLVPGAGNTVTPQFLHLFPTWLALWALFGGGIGAMVYGSAAFGLLGVVATILLARRLFGTAIGILAGSLLAFNGLQLWFARQSLSEIFLQTLLVGGLYTWALFIEARDNGDSATTRGTALIAGLALGSVALTHAQFIFALLPVVALVAWLWLARRWRAIYGWFFIPLAIMLLHATFHIANYSLGYFEGIYHHVWKNAVRDWRQTSGLLLGPTVIIVVLGLRPLRERWLPLVTAQRTLRLGRWLGAFGVLLIGTWLYLIRPGIIRPGNLGAMNGYIGAPVPVGAASALVSLGWYLSPLGMILAGAGLALLLLRNFEERAATLLCLTAPFAVLYLTGTYTQGGYIYSLRRFVPLIVPLMTILTAYVIFRAGPVLATLLRRPRLSRPLWALGFAPAALLLLFLGFTNARLASHREYAGVLAATASLADKIAPNDILLFSGPRDETPKLATPLEYLYGRESWTITTNLPSGDALDTWIATQEAAGRRVHILMSAGGGKLFLPRHRLTAVERVEVPLWQFEKLDNQKPFNQQQNQLGYTFYDLQPIPTGQSALGTVPYRVTAGAGDEFAMLGPSGTTPGFYNVEIDQTGATPLPYRWTDGEALLRIPWPGDGRPLTLRLTLSAGPRPQSLPPAQAVIGIRPTPGDANKERQLTVLTIGNDWTDYTITIPPDAIVPTDDGSALIHIAMPYTFDGKRAPGAVWKPINFPVDTKNSNDGRELHIRFRQAELTVGP